MGASGGMAEVDVVLPAHNEADTIGVVLREFHSTVVATRLAVVRFVVCEDGSSDGTADVVRDLAREIPLEVVSSDTRKGYSRAVIDGLLATSAALVAFVDSDGQCDPSDLPRFLEAIGGADVVVGYRSPRVDPWYRMAMSKSFHLVYRRLFPVRLRDPSCPFVVMRQEALAQILRGRVGLLAQGFWWEFQARAAAAGMTVVEVPCRHRPRLAGETRVYRPSAIPGIARRHLVALVRLRRELRTVYG